MAQLRNARDVGVARTLSLDGRPLRPHKKARRRALRSRESLVSFRAEHPAGLAPSRNHHPSDRGAGESVNSQSSVLSLKSVFSYQYSRLTTDWRLNTED